MHKLIIIFAVFLFCSPTVIFGQSKIQKKKPVQTIRVSLYELASVYIDRASFDEKGQAKLRTELEEVRSYLEDAFVSLLKPLPPKPNPCPNGKCSPFQRGARLVSLPPGVSIRAYNRKGKLVNTISNSGASTNLKLGKGKKVKMYKLGSISIDVKGAAPIVIQNLSFSSSAINRN